MRKSYDFSNAVQGVHHEQYAQGHRVRIVKEGASHADSTVGRKKKGARGLHAARYAEGVEVIVDGKPQAPTVVVLEPDVSAVFPNAESVNEALRLLIKTAKSAQELQKAS